jgi:hypothetical protein
MTWYRTAANAGNTSAANNLAVLLEQRGDLNEAATWYRTAANTGNSNAAYNLGVLLPPTRATPPPPTPCASCWTGNGHRPG